MDKTRDDALELLAEWCSEKGIGQGEYRRRCREYDKHVWHDEMVAALRKMLATSRQIRNGQVSNAKAAAEDMARAALAKVGAL